MKKFSKKPEETKTSKTLNTSKADETRKKVDEGGLDPVELGAVHSLAAHLAMRRVLKDLAETQEEKDGESKPRGILADLEEGELEKLFHVSSEHRIHLDEDEEPWEEPDDDDDDEDDDETVESATNAFLREHYTPNDHGKYVVRPRAKCADGYSVSIQAGSGAGVRCWPHEDTDEFTHVALDMPSCVDEELLPYRFDLDDPNEIFYFFVPVEVVDKVLEKHGGIVGTEDRAAFLVKKMLGI